MPLSDQWLTPGSRHHSIGCWSVTVFLGNCVHPNRLVHYVLIFYVVQKEWTPGLGRDQVRRGTKRKEAWELSPALSPL